MNFRVQQSGSATTGAPIRGKKIMEGALIGFTAGALVGGMIGVIANATDRGAGGDAVSTLVLVSFAVPGAVVGTVIAAIRETRRE
jgi:ABC-type Fe3+ transport system permease subunit